METTLDEKNVEELEEDESKIESELYDNLYESKKGFFNDFKNRIVNIVDNPDRTFSRRIINTDKNLGKIIALDASWGVGKTYFIDCLEDVIKKENKYRGENKDISVKKINAWEAQKYGKPIYAFLLDKDGHEKIKASLNLGLNLGPLTIGADFEPQNDEIKAEINSINEKYDEIIDNDELTIYLIDELDRCNPSYILDFLETLQYVVSMNCAVVSVNLKVLDRLLESTHVKGEEKYYNKIFYDEVPLPFTEEDFTKILKNELEIKNWEWGIHILYQSLSVLTKVTPRLTYKLVDNKKDIFSKIFNDNYFSTCSRIGREYGAFGLPAVQYFAAHALLGLDAPQVEKFMNLAEILDFNDSDEKLSDEEKSTIYKELDRVFYGNRYY